jgi:hypothetical protein
MALCGTNAWAAAALGAALIAVGCGGEGGTAASGAGALQSPCVINQLDLERYIPDRHVCDNWGYSDCTGFGSECINYCAFGFCQPEECETPDDCETAFGGLPVGVKWVCEEYVVSSKGYGNWCEFVEHCTEGTPGCPCLPGGVCGPDPWGEGDMSCAGGTCESSCPSSCIQGSVCCGGSLCSGNCIGTPCCS